MWHISQLNLDKGSIIIVSGGGGGGLGSIGGATSHVNSVGSQGGGGGLKITLSLLSQFLSPELINWKTDVQHFIFG